MYDCFAVVKLSARRHRYSGGQLVRENVRAGQRLKKYLRPRQKVLKAAVHALPVSFLEYSQASRRHNPAGYAGYADSLLSLPCEPAEDVIG